MSVCLRRIRIALFAITVADIFAPSLPAQQWTADLPLVANSVATLVSPIRFSQFGSNPGDLTARDWSRSLGGGFGYATGPWSWELLPDGLLYKSYLAGEKEPRFGSAWLHEKDRGWIWDVSLGGRAGILRYGTPGAVSPEGWQLDIAGAAFPRLNTEEDDDFDSADFRFDVPLTWSRGPLAVKFGYYHISSHVGDEFLERNPDFVRINYVRDAFLLGISYHLNPDFRAYWEAGWAFVADGGAEPWEFQLGFDYSPAVANGLQGVPFLAVNGHLREEFDFGGSLNLMAGWQWRGRNSNDLLRLGLQYFNGKSSQYAFFNENEELLGFGIWYDF